MKVAHTTQTEISEKNVSTQVKPFLTSHLIQSHAESMKKILGANQHSQFSHNLWNWAELCQLAGSQDFLHTFSMALYIINGMSKMASPPMCSNFSHLFLTVQVVCATFILGDFIKKKNQNGRILLQEQYITKHLCIKFTFLLLNDTEIGKIFGTVCTVLLPLAVAAKS